MNNSNKDSRTYKFGYRIGQFFAATVAGCFLALLIALTVKVITLMF